MDERVVRAAGIVKWDECMYVGAGELDKPKRKKKDDDGKKPKL